MISLFFPIEPKAKGRPRTTIRNGRVLVFTPSDTRKWEEEIAALAKNQLKERSFPVLKPEPYPSNQGISIKIWHFLPLPRVLMKKKFWPAAAKRPDLDNLDKTVMDALSGILWENDSLVVAASSAKIFGSFVGIAVQAELVEAVEPSKLWQPLTLSGKKNLPLIDFAFNPLEASDHEAQRESFGSPDRFG